jgi:type II secretory pathway component PulJ
MLNLKRTSRREAGATLIELMIGLSLSLVVVTAMVGLMSNSLGSATRIIQMSQLSDELRNTMSMATRDLRRANYNANAFSCYSNSDCGTDAFADVKMGAVIIEDNNCMIFDIDRDQNGDAESYRAGGFRLSQDGGVGFVEMWVGDADATPACDDAVGGNWLAMTDSDFVDITLFNIDDSASITADVTEEGGSTLNQTTRQILLQIAGTLILDNGITRSMEDTIKVRNDHLWDPSA